MFGPNTGGKAFSFVFTGFAGATLLGWGLSKLRSQDKIKYDALFYILGSLGVLALIMVFFLRDYSKVRTTTISFKNGKKFYANDEIKELLS
mmetsp:Transcript_39443/g.38995  ORF Transcript_39443/g.38995 Transcript_39443/m.38995 type:complete len:91 (-) Transcript_39443:30-302(-)